MKPPIAFTVSLGAFVFCPLKLNLKYTDALETPEIDNDPTETIPFK
jgi:hypothetical protein